MHSTKSEACPNSTTIFEEHPLRSFFHLETSEDSKARENKKALSVKVKSLM